MHQLGEKYYNTRSYENACANFQNILLIQPDDKKAIEYLRISKAKRDALEKLKIVQIIRNHPAHYED